MLPKAFGLTFALPIKKRAFSKEKEIKKVSYYLVGNIKITTFAPLSKKGTSSSESLPYGFKFPKFFWSDLKISLAGKIKTITFATRLKERKKK